MKTTITLLALVVNLSVFSQGIQFIEARTDSDMVAIDKRVKAENKLIFIDGYTTWCGPCKWMEKNVFTNDTVARFFNENFICVRMDMEKGIGISRTYKYEVYAYPTLIFIGPEGIAHRAAGARDAKALMELGETALNPEKRFSHWHGKYKQGNRESAFIREYLKQLNAAGMETKEVADWYFFSLKEDGFLTKENFEIIKKFLQSTDSRVFDYFFANRQLFRELAGAEEVNAKIDELLLGNFWKSFSYEKQADGNMAETVDEAKFNSAMEKLNNSGYENPEKIMLTANSGYYAIKGDWKNYALNASGLVSKYLTDNAMQLNYFAWNYYEHIDDKDGLNEAIGWAKRSLELSETWATADTYTALLYKSGRKKEALKAAEKAIAIGKKTGQDTTPTEELLEKIKGMK